MKKILFVLVLFVIINPAFAQINSENIDYDKIFDSLPVLDIHYDDKEDPEEIKDYESYIKSPYPLIRTSLILSTKNTRIKPGYYLLTPRNKNGYDFVIFKQNGKISALIPIYEKQLINPEITYEKPEKPKKSVLKSAVTLPWTITKVVFYPITHAIGKRKKPPALPQCKVESDYVKAGRYFLIWLYQDEYLYKMIFKVER